MIGLTDVLNNIEAFAVLAIICVIVYVLFIKRKEVLYFLTGDDTIHWNVYDSIFCCCFQCCGLHTWEWTRHVSLFFCRASLRAESAFRRIPSLQPKLTLPS